MRIMTNDGFSNSNMSFLGVFFFHIERAMVSNSDLPPPSPPQHLFKIPQNVAHRVTGI